MTGNLEKSLGIDIYNFSSQRLETEGIIMRCGLTPTDIMHIRGDFSLYDKEASMLAARYFLKCLPGYNDDMESLDTFSEEVYDLVKKKLYENIVRILLADKYPKMCENGLDKQMSSLISEGWKQQKEHGDRLFFDFGFTTAATLVGLGAPTHVFLPDVAKALGTGCTIPEHAEVANAVGAVLADISAKARIEIMPNYTVGGITGYTVYTSDGNTVYETKEEASCAATEAAIRSATGEARKRGALGELSIDTRIHSEIAHAREGQKIELGISVIAIATGRIDR